MIYLKQKIEKYSIIFIISILTFAGSVALIPNNVNGTNTQWTDTDYYFATARIQPSEYDILKNNINNKMGNIPTPILYLLIIILLTTFIIILYRSNRKIKK